jgi:hypothetical protein
MVSLRVLVVLAVALGALGVSVAQAAGGCGIGYHRDYRGYCVPN